MGDLVKIVREANKVSAFIKALNENKSNIKDIFLALRFTDGTLSILDGDVPFETLCTISKKLDLIIDFRQQPELEEDLDDDAEEDV